MRRAPLALALLVLAVLTGCGGGGGGGGGTDPAAGLAVVESVDPPDGAEDVPADAVVEVRFRTPMDPDPLGGGALVLSPAGSNSPVSAEVSVSPDRMRATVTPDGPLSGGTRYQVRLGAEARTAAGRNLRVPWHAEFRTRRW